MTANHHQLFDPGQLQSTQGARALGVEIGTYLRRHLAGDWGKIDPKLQASNERAVELGEGPIASVHDTPAGRLLVITAPDRSATLLLTESELPDEK